MSSQTYKIRSRDLNETSITEKTVDDYIVAVEARMLELLKAGKQFSGISNHALVAGEYHINTGGSRVRARLALFSGLCLGLAPHDAITLAVSVELLHNASLVHDDLQDRDTSRRGMKTVWAEFGDNTAICTGDFLISAAYCAISTFSNTVHLPKLILAIHSCVSTAIHGQSADLSVVRPKTANVDAKQDSRLTQDMELYTEIAAAKSGALLSLPLELALIGSSNFKWIEQAKQASELFAIGYQISDDLCDFDEDKGNDTSTARLNAVSVLLSSSHKHDAKEEAQKLACSYLNEAADLAQSLPNSCGLMLQNLALKLSKKSALSKEQIINQVS